MTPEQQRIAIAEVCGYRKFEIVDGIIYANHRKLESNSTSKASIPDYLNDLNAMHEAEGAQGWHDINSVKGQANYLCYCSWLKGITTRVVVATAAQRAEAFLRTLNLWK